MKTLDRILVATSFSERATDALRKAAVLAAERHAALTLLHVVEPVTQRRLRRLSNQQMLLHARVTHARKELARFAGEIAAKQGVPVEFRIQVGEKVASILAACAEADVLFVGGTRTGWRVGTFHRSTAECLLGRCGIPMVVVNRPQCLQNTRTLVPVADATDAVVALRAAVRLWPGSAMTIFHALDERRAKPTWLNEVPAGAVRERRPERGAALPECLQGLRGLAMRAGLRAQDLPCRFGHGDPWRAVLAIQDEVDADVMVLTKRRASAIADFMLGSTVRRLLGTSPCDVLVIPAEAQKSVRPAPHSRPDEALEGRGVGARHGSPAVAFETLRNR